MKASYLTPEILLEIARIVDGQISYTGDWLTDVGKQAEYLDSVDGFIRNNFGGKVEFFQATASFLKANGYLPEVPKNDQEAEESIDMFDLLDARQE